MIQVNLVKAKAIAHNLRREKRTEAFAPLDILATVPHLAVKAEEDRAIVRSNDDKLQIDMDSAANEDELKALMPSVDEDVILM